MTPQLDRRSLLAGTIGAGLLATAGSARAEVAAAPLAGRVRHSVARRTFRDLGVEELCRLVRRIGFSAIDLVGPQDWPVLRRRGIDSSMCNGAELNLVDGWAEPRFHDELAERYGRHIDLMADAGYRNLVCFSGNRRGMDPQDGIAACERGLKRVLGRPSGAASFCTWSFSTAGWTTRTTCAAAPAGASS